MLKKKATNNEKATTEVIEEEDAIYCSLNVNGSTYECWICDCNELARTAAELEKEKSKNEAAKELGLVQNP